MNTSVLLMSSLTGNIITYTVKNCDLCTDRQRYNPHTDRDDPCVDCCDPYTDSDRACNLFFTVHFLTTQKCNKKILPIVLEIASKILKIVNIG